MKLYKSSLHYRFYRLMWGTKAVFHDNLCSYFWRVFILSPVFLWPAIVLVTPLFLLQVLVGTLSSFRKEGVFGTLITAVFLDLALFCIYSMVGMWWRHPFRRGTGDIVVVVGFLTWLLVIVIGLMFLISSMSVIKKGVAGWWKKYCPKITWED